jgi:DNA-binding transcriptional LysR family regulator
MPNATTPLLDDMLLFVEVVDAGGFTAASARLGLRKSTLSRRIAALEERLGARLLERTTRKSRLTEAGSAYHAQAARIVAEARAANQSVADARGTPRGTLRVAATPLFAETFLPPIVAEYLRRYERTEVELSLSQARVDLLSEGVDVAIRIGALADSSFIARPLGTSRTGYFASAAYVRARGEPRTPEELRGHACILGAGVGSREEWPFVAAGAGEARSIAVSGRLRVPSVQAARAMMREGLGIARLPVFLVEADVKAGICVPVLADRTPPSTQVSAVYPSSQRLSPKVQAFVDICAEMLNDGAPPKKKSGAKR